MEWSSVTINKRITKIVIMSEKNGDKVMKKQLLGLFILLVAPIYMNAATKSTIFKVYVKNTSKKEVTALLSSDKKEVTDILSPPTGAVCGKKSMFIPSSIQQSKAVLIQMTLKPFYNAVAMGNLDNNFGYGCYKEEKYNCPFKNDSYCIVPPNKASSNMKYCPKSENKSCPLPTLKIENKSASPQNGETWEWDGEKFTNITPKKK
jgi:hypothetical protein